MKNTNWFNVAIVAFMCCTLASCGWSVAYMRIGIAQAERAKDICP